VRARWTRTEIGQVLEMLVLTRHIDESIIASFGTVDLEITVLGVSGGWAGPKVKIGLAAPSEVVLLRREVRDRQCPTPQ